MLLLLAAACTRPTPAPEPAVEAAVTWSWPQPMASASRERSDAFTALWFEVEGRLDPEGATASGLVGHDAQIVDWGAGADDRAIVALREVASRLEGLRAAEADPAVAQDLTLLVGAAHRAARRRTLEQQHLVPLHAPARVVHDGITTLVEAGRADAALARLARYADESGPLAVQAEARIREALTPARARPHRGEVERLLAETPVLLGGIASAFAGVPSAAPLLDKLEAQLVAYDAFLRTELLSQAREDARLPAAIYGAALQERGIEGDPRSIAAEARVAFAATVAEMQPIAAEVARERGLPDPDYRAVLLALKQEQVTGDALGELYRERIAELDALLRREALVSLPDRPLAFRFATEAESMRMPAPMYLPPSLLEDDPKPGTFVLPLRDPAATGPAYDDFTFAAAATWLTAHEGRPGHDLQYATMAEHPPSLARSVVAFNSVNAEGWALYAESLVAPYVSWEARLGILQARLMRAAHAFLDIELNLGLIEPSEVRRVMVDEVVFSEAWADTCLHRYTTLLPGQAPSYFYGYQRLVALRRDVETQAPKPFDARAFHDAVLAQGLLPPDLLRAAFLER